MFDFLIAPIVVGSIVLGIYGLFELFVRRNERMAIIEKIGDKLDASAFSGKLSLPRYTTSRFSFSSLKIGCFLMGVGLGLLMAFWISMAVNVEVDDWSVGGIRSWDIVSTLYGACVLFCGGFGLILAFIIEMIMGKKNK